MLFKAQSAAVYRIDAYLVEVEVDVGCAPMQDFDVVGLPDNAAGDARLQQLRQRGRALSAKVTPIRHPPGRRQFS